MGIQAIAILQALLSEDNDLISIHRFPIPMYHAYIVKKYVKCKM